MSYFDDHISKKIQIMKCKNKLSFLTENKLINKLIDKI